MDWTWAPSIPHLETLCICCPHWLSLLTAPTTGKRQELVLSRRADRLLSTLRYSHLQMTVLLIWEGRYKKQGPFSEINMFENTQTSVYLAYLSKLFCLLPAFPNIYVAWEREKEYLSFIQKKKKKMTWELCFWETKIQALKPQNYCLYFGLQQEHF